MFPLLLLFLFLSVKRVMDLKKFAVIYLPLTIILLAISPSSNAGIYGLDRELIAWFTSGLFLTISLLIIGIAAAVLDIRIGFGVYIVGARILHAGIL